MASGVKKESRLVAVTTSDTEVDFGYPMMNHFYFHADTDNVVQVDFDQPTDDSSFLLGTEPIEIDVPAHKVHVRTTSGTANLYILAVY